MSHYCDRFSCPEVLARIWNGGPNGWKKESTKAYWEKVERKIAKGGR